MKKAFLLLIAVLALAGIVWFNVGASGNPTFEVTLYSMYFTDIKAGTQISGGLYSADETIEKISCVATEKSGYVSCQVPETYAGQEELLIQLSSNGFVDVSLVNVPTK